MDTSQNFQIFTIGPDVEGDDSKKAFTWQFIMRPMNECKGFFSEPGTMYLYQCSWDFYSDLKNHSDKTNKTNSPTQLEKQTNSGDSTHWNISIIMLYSSTQSESSVFVVKKFLGVYCSESQKSFLTQCKTLHYTSWAITVHSSP